MKQYNQTFICELPVQLCAEILLEVMNLNVNNQLKYLDGAALKSEKENINTNIEYNIKVVEAIMDSIQDNGQAVTHLFNTMNGWVKYDTPMDTIPSNKKGRQDDNLFGNDTFSTGQNVNITIDGNDFDGTIVCHVGNGVWRVNVANEVFIRHQSVIRTV